MISTANATENKSPQQVVGTWVGLQTSGLDIIRYCYDVLLCVIAHVVLIL